MKKLIILTGTSRGLGLQLAHLFLKAGFSVVGIARTNSIKHPQFYFLKLDLAKTKNISAQLDLFLKKKKISYKNDHVVLINNAATVLPIKYLHDIKQTEIDLSYRLNLQAPMLLSHFFIRKFLAKSNQLTICNISSGAAVRPLINWSVYCSMKSALKMFTDCLNLDYADSKKLKAFSFYPGVMDTQMQETIRQQNPKNFKNVDYFKELKNSKSLLDPEFVAKVIFDITNNPAQIDKTEYNIND